MRKNIKTLIYLFHLVHRLSRFYITKTFLSALFKACVPFLNIILPKFIIDELMGDKRIEYLISYVTALVISNYILRVLNQYLAKVMEIATTDFFHKFDSYLDGKCVDMDYAHIENPEILDLKENVYFSIHNLYAIGRTFENTTAMICELLKLIGLGYILTILNPLVILVIMGIVLMNSQIFKKIEKIRYKDNLTSISDNRAFSYFLRLTSDFSYGKDIRLYKAAPLVLKRLTQYMDNILRTCSRQFTQVGIYTGISKINVQLQIAIIYAYLAYKVVKNQLGLGSLTMYVSAAGSFGTSIMTFVNAFIEINQLCNYLELFIRFDSIESRHTTGTLTTHQTNDYTIEFKNVSFQYPGSDVYTLKNVSIVIPPGERLSIVGLNGAGKTTFIKLLSMLYEPTEGQILLGGTDIRDYKYEEYMKILSIVFQDFKLLSYTIRENICQELALQEDKVHSCLEKSGFTEDLRKLENGLDTLLYKHFDKNGVEFSGGQAQKVAIARALYKDAPIVILDEPTAALDPIAEYEVFHSFNQLIEGKTAIYISHRLSSSRFSDRIAVFDEGKIVECGTHNTLLQNNALYARMFQTQARYYEYVS